MQKSIEEKSEHLIINFLGMRFEFIRPGIKSIIILLILLIFFVAVVVLLKAYVLPLITILGSKKILSSIPVKLSSLIRSWLGRAP
jgi:Na+/serine symporter